MRPYKAYVGLLARMSLGRLLLALAAAAVETVLFWLAMERAFTRGEYDLAAIFDASGIDAVVGTAFVAAGLILSLAGLERAFRNGVHQSRTLRRLGLSLRARGLTQAAYKTGCALLLWAVQLAVLLGLCALYLARAGAAAGPQTMFLAFCRSELLHRVLPLGNPLLWATAIVTVLLLGVASAAASTQGLPFIIVLGYVHLYDTPIAFLSFYGIYMLIMLTGLVFAKEDLYEPIIQPKRS